MPPKGVQSRLAAFHIEMLGPGAPDLHIDGFIYGWIYIYLCIYVYIYVYISIYSVKARVFSKEEMLSPGSPDVYLCICLCICLYLYMSIYIWNYRLLCCKVSIVLMDFWTTRPSSRFLSPLKCFFFGTTMTSHAEEIIDYTYWVTDLFNRTIGWFTEVVIGHFDGTIDNRDRTTKAVLIIILSVFRYRFLT